METTTATDLVLTENMLASSAHRCRGCDIENRFFDEDFRDLKDAGCLTIAVSREFGGRGLDLAACAGLLSGVTTPNTRRRVGSIMR